MPSRVIHYSKLEISFSYSVRALPFSSLFDSKMMCAAACFEHFLISSPPHGLALGSCGAKSFSLHVELCGDKKIRALNNDFRKKDKVTDVLSFPINENLKSMREQLFEMCELGDIFICSSVMKKQAKEFELSHEDEFLHLLVHGFLHLCGHDHELSKEEEILMETLEKKLIKNIAKKLKQGK